MFQRLNWIAPELSHVIDCGEGGTERNGNKVFVTMNGVVGVGFAMDILDVETGSPEALVRSLLHVLRALPEEVRLRASLVAEARYEAPFEHPRKLALREKGYLHETLRIFLEKRDRALSSPSVREALRGEAGQGRYSERIRGFLRTLPILTLKELGARPMTEEEIRTVFLLGRSEMTDHLTHLETATERIGCLRLEKQVGEEIDEYTVARLKQRLSLPFEIRVSLKKKPRKEAHSALRRKLAQKGTSDDVTAGPQADAAREGLQKTVLGNTGVLEMEWLLFLRRPAPEQLSQAIQEVERELAVLGDVTAETVGKLPSLVASLPGAEAHYPIDEFDDAAWAFLPVFSLGEALPQAPQAPKRSFLLHREDDSLFLFDPFARGYQGCNIVMNGIRGSGKSLTANLILDALLKDPRVRVLLFDVGGSYLKHCELFHGRHIQATIDRPSGINVFQILETMPESNDVIQTLSGFLSPLMVERNESELPSTMGADLEHAIKAYGASRPKNPTLADFLSCDYQIPRRVLLERWTRGIYENVFKEAPPDQESYGGKAGSVGLTYFNLENIHNAANADYLKGVFGAVIARANIAMLQAGDARTGNGEILVLFSDETSFIADKYFNYAKFTTSNFRKFGHGTIFIAQQFRSLEKPTARGEIDRGIIENSPIRFIFQVEGTDEEFAANYNLTPAQVARARNLYRGREYRECLLQTPSATSGMEARVVKINVTPEEYWEATSDKTDNQKLYGLMRAVPGLTLKEAIGCLSLGYESDLS